MAQSVAVVRATLPAASGTVDFTKAGFGTPAAAIFVMSYANTTNNPQTDAVFSIGLWDGTNQGMVTIIGNDNLAAMINQRGSDDSRVLAKITPASGLAYHYTASAVTDGVRLTASTGVGLQSYCTCILIAGVSAKVVSFTPSSTLNGTTTSSSLGFEPKLIFFASTSTSAYDIGFQTHLILSFGFAETGGTQRSAAFVAIDGATDEDARGGFSETRCILSSAAGYSAELTTFGADTFTTTTRDFTINDKSGFALALGGADLSYDCGTLTTPTSTGNSVVSTDIAPDALILLLTTNDATGWVTDSRANGYMVGMADDNGQFAHGFQVEDAAGTSNSNSTAQAAAVLDLDSSSGGSRTDMCDATVTLNSSDFTLNYSATDGTARKGWWVAFGAAGGGGGGSNVSLMQISG